jgi:hypothetical protein
LTKKAQKKKLSKRKAPWGEFRALRRATKATRLGWAPPFEKGGRKPPTMGTARRFTAKEQTDEVFSSVCSFIFHQTKCVPSFPFPGATDT